MADSAQVEGRNGGGSGEQPDRRTARHAQAPYAHASAYVYVRAYAHVLCVVLLAMKASGLLALLLSTAVLLGGFVSSLEKDDFFNIILFTAIQAAGIFTDWERSFTSFVKTISSAISTVDDLLVNCKNVFSRAVVVVVALPFLVVSSYSQAMVIMAPFYGLMSFNRIWKLNHSNWDHRTSSVANKMAALNMFYSLIIFQVAVLLVFGIIFLAMSILISNLQAVEHLSEEWGRDAIVEYIFYISLKCKKDPESIKGMDMVKYAAELLDSESQKDYLRGARLLSAFVNKGKDVTRVLLPSSHKIQKLVDSLWISSTRLDESTEIMELATTILVGVAGHIDVARYHGVMRWISALLQHQEERHRNQMMDQQRMVTREHRRLQKSQGSTSKKLIQQGLTILERLASNNDDNRRIICSTPGLLPKITAPVYSATLIEDVKTKAWANIVIRCLKVLYQLIRTPDGSHEIFSNNVQALTNLKSIIELGNNEADHQELQVVAMKILTALDLSINLNEEVKQVLITKQLQLFLANGDGTAMAGRALVSLSAISERNSTLIMTTQDDIVDRLIGILNDENNITRRTIAAQIMANLCPHCNVDNTMKEILLPKVLREIMSIKTRSQERNVSEGQNNPALGDEENQGNSVSTNNEGSHRFSWMLRVLPKCCSRTPHQAEEISDQEREEQEAFLSLAQVICDKLDSADLDGAIQSAVDQNNAGSEEQRREAFVDKLKTIIDGNCHPAADNLRIVKLCGQIAISVLGCEQYEEIFRNRGFKSSLSEASKIMSELESCMLFIGTDFGLKKTMRPLLSEIEKTWSEM